MRVELTAQEMQAPVPEPLGIKLPGQTFLHIEPRLWIKLRQIILPVVFNHITLLLQAEQGITSEAFASLYPAFCQFLIKRTIPLDAQLRVVRVCPK